MSAIGDARGSSKQSSALVSVSARCYSHAAGESPASRASSSSGAPSALICCLLTRFGTLCCAATGVLIGQNPPPLVEKPPYHELPRKRFHWRWRESTKQQIRSTDGRTTNRRQPCEGSYCGSPVRWRACSASCFLHRLKPPATTPKG